MPRPTPSQQRQLLSLFGRLPLGVRLFLILALIVVALVAYFISRRPAKPPTTTPTTTETSKPFGAVPSSTVPLNSALGNPSNANTSSPDNYLLQIPQYTLSYNRSRGIPNWVSWRLATADTGTVDRANDFRPNSSLPPGFPRITPSDYTGSGFDRGHLCPSADRSDTPEDNSATFLMTNIVPQSPDNNRGPWQSLEAYCRELTQDGSTLLITAGAYGEQGKLKGKVTVPAHTWKVIVVMPPGTGGAIDRDIAQQVTDKTRVIAVDLPNTNGIKSADWRQFRTSVDQIENVTQLDLLAAVNASTQSVIEARVDNQ